MWKEKEIIIDSECLVEPGGSSAEYRAWVDFIKVHDEQKKLIDSGNVIKEIKMEDMGERYYKKEEYEQIKKRLYLTRFTIKYFEECIPILLTM